MAPARLINLALTMLQHWACQPWSLRNLLGGLVLNFQWGKTPRNYPKYPPKSCNFTPKYDGKQALGKCPQIPFLMFFYLFFMA